MYWLEGFKAYRKPLLAAHRALGFVVWSLGIATCMSGVTEKATFVYAYGTANFKVVTLLDHYSPALFLPGLLQLALAGLWTCTAVHLLFPFFEEGPRKAGGAGRGGGPAAPGLNHLRCVCVLVCEWKQNTFPPPKRDPSLA